MFFKRSSIIRRAVDSIENKNIEDFDYLPTEAYIELLKTTKLMDIGREAV